MAFPEDRMRDKRITEETRRKYRETGELSPKDLVMPIFVKEGISKKNEISSMPGIYQFPFEDVAAEAQRILDAGVPAVILFGIPEKKDETGSGSYAENGVVQKAIRIIKEKVPEITVIGDVCMCEYTSHGHCGILNKSESRGRESEYIVDNDATIEILGKIAVSYAKAGADIVAPSAMMDGQVKAIKDALTVNVYPDVKIMSYSAKYASAFYGPFRDAAESPPRFGDRRTYQMDHYNSDEAILESAMDIEEGADILMVKPALAYQDIICRLKKELNFPLACYSVSGEYAMFKAAAAKGYLNEEKVVLESLVGLKRAGADTIITYYAVEAAKWLTK